MSTAVVACGVDTWSPCWYVDRDSLAGAWLDGLATAPAKRGRMLPGDVLGYRVGWDRASGMLYAEGHPTADGLCAPGELPAALDGLVAALLAADVPVPNGVTADVWMGFGDHGCREDGFAGLRRVDTTLDLAVDAASEGLAIMSGVAGVSRDAAKTKAEVIWSVDGRSVETVYFRGRAGRKVLGRWYDKGVESKTAAAGRHIRPEDQRRYVKGLRRDVGELSAPYLRRQFHDRFLPLWQASKGVTVAGLTVLSDKLTEAVEAGEITAEMAEKLGGYLLLARQRERLGLSRRTDFRRRAAVRDLGLILADGVLQEVEVDLHDVLDQCMDGPAWGCDQ
jgi:hypothetical protein